MGIIGGPSVLQLLIADALIEQRFYDPTVVIIDIAPETFPNVINVDADDVVTVSIFGPAASMPRPSSPRRSA